MYLLSEELGDIEELARSSRKPRQRRTESSNASTDNDYLPVSLAGTSHVSRLFSERPPTPEPSPRPATIAIPELATAQALAWAAHAQTYLPHLPLAEIESLMSHLTPAQFAHLNANLRYSRRRDFLSDLPPELALHVLGFVEEVGTVLSAGRVCKRWGRLVSDEAVWRRLCERRGFVEDGESYSSLSPYSSFPPFSYHTHFKSSHMTEYNWMHHSPSTLLRTHRSPDACVVTSLAMDDTYIVIGLANGRVHVFSIRTGMLVRTLVGHEAGVWCVWLVGRGGTHMNKANNETETDNKPADDEANSLENESPTSMADMPFQSVFDSLRPGSSQNATAGSASSPNFPPSSPNFGPSSSNFSSSSNFDSGSSNDTSNPNTSSSPSDLPSDPCNTSIGWGQSASLVVSAGCDKHVKVWDVKTGLCLYTLRGHRSTVRCLKMLHGRPIAVSGGRDHTVRIWDVRKGLLLKTLEGHTDSVRCLDVYGDRVVSGSYDCTVRLWDITTGSCLRVFNGHYHQVYTVAFDGERIVSGGLDTSVRVWGVESGTCIALLQGHTTLVCQLQLSARTGTIISGSADGRIIIFEIPPLPSSASATHNSDALTPNIPALAASNTGTPDAYRIVCRLPAHSSSVTGLQFDDHTRTRGKKRWLISGGGDGRVLLWDVAGVVGSPNPSASPSSYPIPPTVLSDPSLSLSSRARSPSPLPVNPNPTLVRALTAPCEGLWKIAFRGDTVVICCLRGGRTVLEVWGFGSGGGVEGGL